MIAQSEIPTGWILQIFYLARKSQPETLPARVSPEKNQSPTKKNPKITSAPTLTPATSVPSKRLAVSLMP